MPGQPLSSLTFPSDQDFMQQALTLAARGLGRTHPNPPVGCVLVKHGQVIGQGHHPKAGEAHAEVHALREAQGEAQGATAYVTLEPCAHHGRTPPCADALIAAGVSRVVIAALDPNPLVAGQGATRLREAGIEVLVGVLEQQAVQQQAGFRTRMVLGRPRVTCKWAQTLDGKVAPLNPGQLWLTGPEARTWVHQLRNQTDAIGVGSNTVLIDGPQLTTRLDEANTRDPIPVVFDRSGRVPLQAAALRPGAIVVTASERFYPDHLQVIRHDHLPDVLQELGRLGLTSLLLEGGPTLASAFLAHDLIDELKVLIAPSLLGQGHGPFQVPLERLKTVGPLQTQPLGADLLLQATLHPIPTLQHTLQHLEDGHVYWNC